MEDDNNTQQESGSLKKKNSSSIRLLSRGKQSAMHIAVELQDKEWLDGWIG